MTSSNWTLYALTLLCSLTLSAPSAADEPALSPEPGILVLRSGNVLRGSIFRVGDRYVVSLGNQDEVGVPQEAVEMQCSSLEDAYLRKRAILTGGNSAEHLKLADWCLQYGLYAGAAEQLIASRQRDPANPQNDLFEKRLRLAVQHPTTQSPPPASPPRILAAGSDLKELSRSLPPETVQQFTTVVQPLLINRCGDASCHGAASSNSFRLTYSGGGRSLSQRFTQRNLHTALSLIDRESPAASPLLHMATTPHGGRSRPALSDEDVTQLQRLAQWVYRSQGKATPAPPDDLTAPNPLLLQPSARQQSPSSPLAQAIPPADAIDSATDPMVQQAGHEEAVAEGKGDAEPLSLGKDPFDPEVFNRRYSKRPVNVSDNKTNNMDRPDTR